MSKVDTSLIVPGLGPAKRENIHEVPDGHTVDLSTGDAVILDPKGKPLKRTPITTHHDRIAKDGSPSPPVDSGWICDAFWNNNTGSPITGVQTTWVVPPPPPAWDGQLIYLFPGTQNNTLILQPVLQYGFSPAGGGQFWAFANWLADGINGSALFTPIWQVAPGATIVGHILNTGRNADGTYNYECYAEVNGSQTPILTVTSLAEMFQAVQTLEAYNIAQQLDYPEAYVTQMTGIGVATAAGWPALGWITENRIITYGSHAITVSNSNAFGGEVDLYYLDIMYPINQSPPYLTVESPGPFERIHENNGVWSGTLTGFSYGWQTSLNGVNWSNSPSGNATQVYQVSSSDYGTYIRAGEIGYNGPRFSPAAFTAPVYVPFPVPSLISPPTLAGSPTVGSTLSVTPGSWNYATSYRYQWQWDSATNIPTGQHGTSSQYTITTADIGHTLRCLVYADNTTGESTPAATAATGVVGSPVPSIQSGPFLAYTTIGVGQTVSVTQGNWSFSPTSYRHQWQRNDQDIVGQIGTSYTIVSADVGATIRVVEWATNATGEGGPAYSAESPQVPAQGSTIPTNISPPTIQGTVVVGQTLSLTHGQWTNAPASYGDQWQRNNADVAGQTGATYLLTSADAGASIRVGETATNASGTSPSPAYSAAVQVSAGGVGSLIIHSSTPTPKKGGAV